MAGKNAYAKGIAIGVFDRSESRSRRPRRDTTRTIVLMDVPVQTTGTPEGARALAGEKPISPESVERYLESKFGEALTTMRRAMERLARAVPKTELRQQARSLYESFRPEIPRGEAGWGAKGVLDSKKILALIE
jgi:hypothetical protein